MKTEIIFIDIQKIYSIKRRRTAIWTEVIVV